MAVVLAFLLTTLSTPTAQPRRRVQRSGVVTGCADPDVGCWENVLPWPDTAIHAALVSMPEPFPSTERRWKVLFWDWGTYPWPPGSLHTFVGAQLWEWDSGFFTDVSFSILNSGSYTTFCAGHSLLDDGKLMLAGGHFWQPLPDGKKGPVRSYWFDPAFTPVGAGSWQRRLDMTDPVCAGTPQACVDGGRFYPTVITAQVGLEPTVRVLAVHGTDKFGSSNLSVESYNPLADTWTGESVQIPIDPVTSLYPWLHVLPESPTRLFFSGHFAGAPGTDPRFAYTYNVADRVWSPRLGVQRPEDRVDGTSVLLPLVDPQVPQPQRDSGRILILGGRTTGAPAAPILNSTEYYCVGPNVPSSCVGSGEGWRAGTPMAFPRQHANPVLLADGQVGVFGGERLGQCVLPAATCPIGVNGNCVPVYEAELYDPQTRIWRTVPAPPEGQRRPRQYHSVAILLPDGSVLVMGGETDQHRDCFPAAPGPTAQIYRPGYFFRELAHGPRPLIGQMSARRVGYNQQVDVDVLNAGANAKAILIRAGSVTHSFNPDQRLVELRQTIPGQPTTFRLTMPSNANVAPPGYYMLFVVKNYGQPHAQPSVQGEWIQLVPVP